MKKTYINPEMEIVKIQTTGMLAASLPTGSTPTDPANSDAPELPGIPPFVFDLE